MMKLSQLLLLSGVALLANSLSAQDAPPQGEAQSPGSGPGFQFSQGVGAQYDSKLGFVPSYRVELAAPVVRNEGLMVEAKLTNDFNVLADKLDLSLATRFRLASWLTASIETPLSLTYRAPTDFSGQVAAAAKLAVSNRQEPQDRPGSGAAGAGPGPSPGWVLAGELSTTATAAWGTTPQEARPAYLAAAQFELGYRGVASPGLKMVATADLSTLTLVDVKSIASLSFGRGPQEPSVQVSAETSLYAGLGDTKVSAQISSGHLVASAAVGVSQMTTSPVLDYSVGIGYRF